MRFLLDTNVWRYLVDSGYQDNLFLKSRKTKSKIVVAPSIIIETLRLGDLSLRRKIIEVQTRACWHRLMPDSYLQSEDVKSEIARLHPDWFLPYKNLNLYRRLRYDWIRSKGGFWEKVRTNTDFVANQYNVRDHAMLNLLRQQLRDFRSDVYKSKKPLINTPSLKNFTGSWKNSFTGETVTVDAWRVYALTVWTNLLSNNKSPLYQWLNCDLNVEFLLWGGIGDFAKFWQSEVKETAVPREWIRAAIYALQSERKVTDGNPTDSQIAVHAVDVDFIVSADKNFIEIIKQIQNDAPFETASGLLIASGKEGINQLFDFLSLDSVL